MIHPGTRRARRREARERERGEAAGQEEGAPDRGRPPQRGEQKPLDDGNSSGGYDWL